MSAKRATPGRLRWYVLYTAPQREHIAAVHVARLGYPVFIPMAYAFERKGKTWIYPTPEGPLFPRYIFVALRRGAPWGEIARARGVSRVICSWEGTPLAVPTKEMRAIRRRDGHYQKKRRFRERFKPGQRVRISKGPFAGIEGLFDASAANRVKVLLSLFGGKAAVSLEEDSLEAA